MIDPTPLAYAILCGIDHEQGVEQSEQASLPSTQDCRTVAFARANVQRNRKLRFEAFQWDANQNIMEPTRHENRKFAWWQLLWVLCPIDQTEERTNKKLNLASSADGVQWEKAACKGMSVCPRPPRKVRCWNPTIRL